MRNSEQFLQLRFPLWKALPVQKFQAASFFLSLNTEVLLEGLSIRWISRSHFRGLFQLESLFLQLYHFLWSDFRDLLDHQLYRILRLWLQWNRFSRLDSLFSGISEQGIWCKDHSLDQLKEDEVLPLLAIDCTSEELEVRSKKVKF